MLTTGMLLLLLLLLFVVLLSQGVPGAPCYWQG
jgi:hypothetical protein